MADICPISKGQLRTLDKLKKLDSLHDFYLGGGTAIAHHLKHRISRDLDLFSKHGNIDIEEIHHEIAGSFDDIQIVSVTKVSIHFIDLYCSDFIKWGFTANLGFIRKRMILQASSFTSLQFGYVSEPLFCS